MAETRQIEKPLGSAQDYLDRIGKLVPAEITAGFLAVQPLLINKDDVTENFTILLMFVAFLTVLVPLYLWKLFNVTNVVQLAFSALSFPVWAGAICAEQVIIRSDGAVSNVVITLVMVGWALLIPLIVPPKPQTAAP